MYWLNTSDNGRLMSSDSQRSYWADSSDDIANLPHINTPGVQQGNDTVSCLPCGKGSTCMVIGDGHGALMYGLKSTDEWVLM